MDNHFEAAQYSTDYTDRCGNCHEFLEKEDRFCRYCGTRRGEGEFEPYLNLFECVYGPKPVRRKHRCTQCGNEWMTCLMIDDEKYCPLCGGKAELVWEDSKSPYFR